MQPTWWSVLAQLVQSPRSRPQLWSRLGQRGRSSRIVSATARPPPADSSQELNSVVLALRLKVLTHSRGTTVCLFDFGREIIIWGLRAGTAAGT